MVSLEIPPFQQDPVLNVHLVTKQLEEKSVFWSFWSDIMSFNSRWSCIAPSRYSNLHFYLYKGVYVFSCLSVLLPQNGPWPSSSSSSSFYSRKKMGLPWCRYHWRGEERRGEERRERRGEERRREERRGEERRERRGEERERRGEERRGEERRGGDIRWLSEKGGWRSGEMERKRNKFQTWLFKKNLCSSSCFHPSPSSASVPPHGSHHELKLHYTGPFVAL